MFLRLMDLVDNMGYPTPLGNQRNQEGLPRNRQGDPSPPQKNIPDSGHHVGHRLFKAVQGEFKHGENGRQWP